MRNYRNFAAALVLTLALTASAFAGEMHTDKTPPPTAPTTNGEMHTGASQIDQADLASGADTMTEVALNLLQSMFSLF